MNAQSNFPAAERRGAIVIEWPKAIVGALDSPNIAVEKARNRRESSRQSSVRVDGATPVRQTGKSMSRRSGQKGHLEQSGRWWVVRFWIDVPGQEKRALKRERVCPVAGPGVLSQSARERRAKEIIFESGADSEERFNKVVKQSKTVTFREQAERMVEESERRTRRPLAPTTIDIWKWTLKRLLEEIGDVPLSEVNNSLLKRLISKLNTTELSKRSVVLHIKTVKSVVASALDSEGEPLFPRKWNNEFVEMPIVKAKDKNTPVFSSEIVSRLTEWRVKRERLLFILCGATGLRISEALGLEVDKHFNNDFTVIDVRQQVAKGKLIPRLKTEHAYREINIHSDVAAEIHTYPNGRTSGLLFGTRNGKPLHRSNILRRHLHPALRMAGYLNWFTMNHKSGNHAFRRFRNTYLRNYVACPEGLLKYWMGHALETMLDEYDKIKEDNEQRSKSGEQFGYGFDIRRAVPNVPKEWIRRTVFKDSN